jgi:hypothetical protein
MKTKTIVIPQKEKTYNVSAQSPRHLTEIDAIKAAEKDIKKYNYDTMYIYKLIAKVTAGKPTVCKC